MKNNYFIRNGYRTNIEATTKIDNGHKYWGSCNRIEGARIYQYHVYQRAAEIFEKEHFQTLLDVGSGPPFKIAEMFAHLNPIVTLLDLPAVEEIAKQVLPHATFIEADIEVDDIEFSRDFDMIICADVIEHLIDPDKCLDIIKKALADDGIAVISTPERDHIRGPSCNYSPKPEHVREWNYVEFAAYLASRGFEIIEHTFIPRARIPRWEFWISKNIPIWLTSSYRPLLSRWAGNQMVICRLSTGDRTM